MQALIPFGLLALGLVNCFFGFKTFRFSIATWGFLIAALIAGILTNNTTTVIIAGIIGGLLLLVAYRIGIYVMGALVGVLFVSMILSVLGVNSWVITLALWVMVGLITGGMAVALEKPVIILATAFGGALSIVIGFLLLTDAPTYLPLGLQAVNSLPLLGVLAWIAIGVAGTIFQFGGIANMRKQYADAMKQMREGIAEYKKKQQTTSQEK